MAVDLTFLTPEDVSDLHESMKDVVEAAREVDRMFAFNASAGEALLNGSPVNTDACNALLMLHDYLNDVERIRFELAAVALVRQQETIHERHACPRCHAAKGSRCRRVGTPAGGATLKHSHRERIRLELADR